MVGVVVLFVFRCVALARPPAWRTVQSDAWTQGLRGAPPCLAGLPKVGQGHQSRWLLCSYRDANPEFEVYLTLDRNPDEPCYKLLFHSPSSQNENLGFILLAAVVGGSSLRGMKISEAHRGKGLCKVLLAAWLQLCLEAGVAPSTRVINKPLLSHSLARLGFRPTNGRGQLVQLTTSKRLRDCKRADYRRENSRGERYAFVRTAFDAPSRALLYEATQRSLEPGRLDVAASPEALHCALTLRPCPPKVHAPHDLTSHGAV